MVLAFGLDVNLECCALHQLAFATNRSSHGRNNLIANRQPQASALPIPGTILIKLPKIEEQLLLSFLGDANPRILDFYEELSVDNVTV